MNYSRAAVSLISMASVVQTGYTTPTQWFSVTYMKKKMLKKSGFSKITHIIVAMYFTTFEGLIVYRNTCRPCYVSKRAYSCCVGEF